MSYYGCVLACLVVIALVAVLQLVRPALGRVALRRWAESRSIALHEAKSDSWGYARFPSGTARSRICFRIRVTMPDGGIRTGHALAGPAGMLFGDTLPVDVLWDWETPVPPAGAAAAR